MTSIEAVGAVDKIYLPCHRRANVGRINVRLGVVAFYSEFLYNLGLFINL